MSKVPVLLVVALVLLGVGLAVSAVPGVPAPAGAPADVRWTITDDDLTPTARQQFQGAFPGGRFRFEILAPKVTAVSAPPPLWEPKEKAPTKDAPK